MSVYLSSDILFRMNDVVVSSIFIFFSCSFDEGIAWLASVYQNGAAMCIQAVAMSYSHVHTQAIHHHQQSIWPKTVSLSGPWECIVTPMLSLQCVSQEIEKSVHILGVYLTYSCMTDFLICNIWQCVALNSLIISMKACMKKNPIIVHVIKSENSKHLLINQLFINNFKKHL